MFLNGSGGECVRFRNRAANSLIVNSVIQWCGMLGQGDDVDQYKYHNAEGVYVGTSPKSTDQPMYANDTSNNIVVRNSTINTYGSECFEVKENAHHNRIENSDCGWNDEPSTFQGSNVEFRGDHNTVLGSTAEQQPQLEHEAGVGLVHLRPGRQHRPGDLVQRRRHLRDHQPADGLRALLRRHLHRPGQRSQRQQRRHPDRDLRRLHCADGDGRTPAANATAVAATTTVTATFSEAVQGVSGTTFSSSRVRVRRSARW